MFVESRKDSSSVRWVVLTESVKEGKGPSMAEVKAVPGERRK
jgi:hypothetical protein